MKNKHEKLREILQSYGNEEYGDAIIDEISLLFNYGTTKDKEMNRLRNEIKKAKKTGIQSAIEESINTFNKFIEGK